MKRIEQKVISFIDENGLINKNDKVLIALSGGPDSVFLLYFLSKFKWKYKIEISAIHINHMIRGKVASEDQEFCQKLSVSLGIKFYTLNRNVKHFAKKKKLSLEEAGRILRYTEFNKVLKRLGFSKIATAHNSSDNAETVLLNLIKGTGLKGISGIPVKRENIIRPVLCLTKVEILDYLNSNKIEYRIDHTNFSNEFERSFLRNSVIPLIKEKLNPDFENAVLHSSEIFKNISSFVDNKTKDIFKNVYTFENGELKISVSKLKELGPEIEGYFFKSILFEKFNFQTTYSDFKSLNSLILKESGKTVYLSNEFRAFRDREFIIILRSRIAEKIKPNKIRIGDSLELNGRILNIERLSHIPEKFSGSKLTEYISGDNIFGNFVLRPWQDGDKFFPLGLKGSQKISDFLNGLKLSTSKKKEQLVLTNNDRIVWVVGYRLDERFKILNNTKKVIKLCLK